MKRKDEELESGKAELEERDLKIKDLESELEASNNDYGELWLELILQTT